MGFLDPANTPPLVQEESKKTQPTTVTPTATPPATPPQKDAKPPEPPAEKPTPGVMPKPGTGVEDALKGIAGIEARRSEMPPPMPKLPEKPKTINDDIRLWGSLAIAFAAFASMRTRTPMMTALNAAAAAVNGMRAGETARADQAYKEWEKQTQIALETSSYEQRAYEEVMNNMTRREELAMRGGEAKDREAEMQMRATTSALNDPVMWQAYQTGGLKAAQEVQKSREVQAQKLAEAKLQVSKGYTSFLKVQAVQQSPEFKQAQATGDTTTMIQMLTEAAPENPALAQINTPQFIDQEAKAILNYQQAPYQSTTGRGTSASHGLMVMKRVRELAAEQGKSYDANNFYAVRKEIQDMTTGKGAQAMESLNMLMGHLETLETLAKKLPNDASVQLFNAMMTSAARETGHPEISSYDAAKSAVKDEFTKVMLGTGAGALSDRAEKAAVLGEKQTKQQLEASIDTIKELVRSRIQAKYQILSALPNPDRFFNPKMLDFFHARPGETGSTSPAPESMPGGETPSSQPVSQTKGAPVSQEQAQQQAPQGSTSMRQMQDGSWIYAKDGKWVRADGGPVK